jgi:hypothetical protein
MSKSAIPNFQMIHIASELVALVGITFYFTSKHNSVMSEIKKLQNIVQKQQSSISQYDQKITELTKLVQKLKSQVNNPVVHPEQFIPMGQPPMFDDPVEVLGQMMGGSMGPIFPPRHPGERHQPTQPSHSNHSNHNIHVVSDDTGKTLPDDDLVETDSQLDAQLSDELAELQSSAKSSPSKHGMLPDLSTVETDSHPTSETNLNADRSNNNSVLSINDSS